MIFRQQVEAIALAGLLVQRLPAHARWALSVTEQDAPDSPSTLNIFAPESEWPSLVLSLRLTKPADRSLVDWETKFVSYRHGSLLISLIEPEEQ